MNELGDPASRAVFEDLARESESFSAGALLWRTGIRPDADAYAYANANADAYNFISAFSKQWKDICPKPAGWED